ncbi:hypothetical protein PAAG_02138 [Paracoccidioides lutzii Pb01]|uniref:Uncharacterized protein n=1 Tax=Paracoccidioides lutzii (strain ATCC MYA-826 / Pb01) TaxID=502779 RepID=C1GUE3_PARBA|nr:hypothetical protein PAAG_02138 [Paracoccidioides lutzii Pb01]EEH39949.2 hypothetical protein PAAG_02138 [Paracoccidioides lutzii Pb01]
MDSAPISRVQANPSIAPIQLSFPAPKSPYMTIHIHLTFFATSTLVFLTTTNIGESSNSPKPMGSFVYAMPDCTNPKNTISTPLYTSPSSLDYATRTARALAQRTSKPVYVGCNVDFSGSTIEEQMEGFKKILETVMEKWQQKEEQKKVANARQGAKIV